MALDLSSAPRPSDLTHLRPRNGRGLVHLLACCGGTTVSLVLSLQPNWMLWLAGQLLLAFFLVQWFIFLHECGHGVLFRSRRVNTLVGHLASFFCGIPYHSWTLIHGMHHKWTGWQDRDPTTAGLVPRTLGRLERAAMNFCWRYWVPVFTLIYRLSNFWNLGRLLALSKRGGGRRAANAVLLAAAYVAFVVFVGFEQTVRLFGVATLLSMIFLDPIMLSQHTHIPTKVSNGADVKPFGAREQLPFTRSLRFPRWFGEAMLLNFDAHELHHMYPQVPGYDLRRIDYPTPNEASWWRWIAKARALPADVFLFQNRDHSGSDV